MFKEPHFDPKRRLNKRPTILDQCTFLIVVDEALDMEDNFAVDVDNIQASAGPAWQDSSVLRLAHSSLVQFLEQAQTLSEHAREFSVTKDSTDTF